MNRRAVFHVGHSLAGFFRGDYARGFFARLAVQVFALVVLVEARLGTMEALVGTMEHFQKTSFYL